jgi:hypothetical protein
MTKRQPLPIVSPPHQPDPLRVALAAAIKAMAEAKGAAANNEKAIDKARCLCVQRERAVEEAQADADSARDQLATTMASAICDDNEPPTTSREVIAADEAVSTATNLLAAARTGLDKLRSDQAERRAAVVGAEEIISGQIAAVTSPAIEELVTRAERALADLARYAAVLRYLGTPDDDPSDRLGRGFGRPIRLSAELHQRVINLLNERSVSLLQFNLSDEIRALVQRWRETRAQLRASADTPLPPLPGFDPEEEAAPGALEV